MDKRVNQSEAAETIRDHDTVRAPRPARYITHLLTVAAVLIALYVVFFRKSSLIEGLESLLYVGLVIVGIGLLIFIHELGHFLAAKLCDTKVTVFSVGFGPPIPGCSFQYGETFYKLAVCPIGGYVKLPGENPGDVDDEEMKKDPRLLPNKSVSQRLLIFSAGVVMNVILGAIFFVIVYLHGKEERSGLLGAIEPGSPAARAGLVAGSRLLEVDGKQNPTFEDLFFATALAQPNKTEVRLRWLTPLGEVREGILVPRKLPSDSKPMIGIAWGNTNKLADGKIEDEFSGRKRPLESRDFGTKDSPVEAASFEAGDFVIGIRPAKEGGEFLPVRSEYERHLAEYRLRKVPVDYLVQRGGSTAVVRVEPRLFRSAGIYLTMGPIVSVTSPKFTPPTAHQLQEGDVIVGVDGQRDFDPMRLPDLFMDAVESKDQVTLDVRRGDKEEKLTFDAKQLRGRGLWNEEMPNSPGSYVGIPALGIAYRIEPIVSAVDPNASEALKKLLGDENLLKGTLVRVAFQRSDGSAEELKVAESEYQWPHLFFHLQSQGTRPVTLTVERDGQMHMVEVTPFTVPGWYWPNRGFRIWAFEADRQVVVADGVWDALKLGTVDTGRFIVRIYLNLRSLLTGNLSVKYLSGPIEMFKQTYSMAEAGMINLILFLAIISINLAVVNFLPIPVLDGGHVMFLLIEKIRGKPASERVFMIANAIGLTMVLGLMLFVVCLDFSKMQWVQRLFGM